MPGRRSLGLALGLLALAGCGPTAPAPIPAPAATGPLRVAAASDLQAALPVLAERFARARGHEVVPILGSSGQLAQQVEQGAPYDVFLSANRSYVDRLAAGGHVDPGSVRPYARGVLVLVVSRRAGVEVGGLPDLRKPEVKHVAIANPDVAPYGLAARQVLERSGLDDVAPKLVQAESVRHALQFVQTGNAEVGLVALSVADVPEVRRIELDLALYDPIVQYLGVVAHTEHPAAAREFADFLLGDEGRSLLASYGFLPAGDAPPAAPDGPPAR